MSYTAPTLTTTISVTDYRTQIDTNFDLIQDALRTIQSELGATPTNTSVGNMSTVDYLCRPDGIVGTESFPLFFGTDDTLYITHPDTSYGSACVINNRLHIHKTDTTFDLTTVVTDDSAAHRVAIGIDSLGAPSCSLVCVESDNTTEDATLNVDLLLYTLDITRTGDFFSIANLRRECPLLMSGELSNSLAEQEEVMTLYYTDAFPAVGETLRCVFICPFDCEITGGYGYLANGAGSPNQVILTLKDGSTNIMSNTATWAVGEEGIVRTLLPKTEKHQATAGTKISCVVSAVGDISTASDLTISLKLRKIYTEIY